MNLRLKRESTRNRAEREIIEGVMFNYEDQIETIKNISGNKRNSVFPLLQQRIMSFEFEFTKSYLYALYTNVLKNSRIEIQSYNAMASYNNPVVIAPLISSFDNKGIAIIENDIIYVNLKFDGASYQITVLAKPTTDGRREAAKFFISVLGIDADSHKTSQLISHIVSESIKNSYFRNKVLKISCDDGRIEDIQEADIKEFEDEKLENIFIPDKIKNELIRFKQCVENYKNIGLGLRFLLSGVPGTGKTKSVRTLINLCYHNATIILVEGEVNFKTLFYFAKLFEPAIICLDDLDLLVGMRGGRNYEADSLGCFLQELDGFDKNNVFLLVTTNDKELIDEAASRPGRFDLVIDFSKLDIENYLQLIKSKCSNEIIIGLFDKATLQKLKNKKVTGAFIVNLIKQLEIKHKLEPSCNLENYLNDFIELSYSGFYKKLKEEQTEFGFSGCSTNGE